MEVEPGCLEEHSFEGLALKARMLHAGILYAVCSAPFFSLNTTLSTLLKWLWCPKARL